MKSATDAPNRPAAPLSPVLLAGFALRPLPPGLLSPFLDMAVAATRRRHPEVFDRLETLGDARFLIDPLDLPFCFTLRPGGRAPRLRAVRDGGEDERPTAIIRGPLLVLIDLLEGRLDGDALFFSRDLAIEGDTEAVLALRNAVDSGEIDVVEDLLSLLGPLGGPARQAWGLVETIFSRAARDLETLHRALVDPLAGRCDRQAAELRELEATVSELRRRPRRAGPADRRAAKPGIDEP